MKFRGKDIENNEWVIGYYGYKDLTDEHFIIVPTFDSNSDYRPQYFTDYLVHPESVGQYTGLKDKNGVEIYEGDIVSIEGAGKTYIRTIVFEKGTFHFGYIQDGMCDYQEMQVIGNKFENPELLEVEK